LPFSNFLSHYHRRRRVLRRQERAEGLVGGHLEGGSADHLLRSAQDLRKDSGEDAGVWLFRVPSVGRMLRRQALIMVKIGG